MMMMIAPNSRVHKGGKEKEKERGEVKGSMKEHEGRRRRGMLTTEEWCNTISNMLHHL